MSTSPTQAASSHPLLPSSEPPSDAAISILDKLQTTSPVKRSASSRQATLAKSPSHSPKRSISAPAAHAVPLGDSPGTSSVAWLRDTWHEHANRSLALATKLSGFQGCPSPVGTPGSLTNGAAFSFSSSFTKASAFGTAGYLCGKKRLASSREIWVVLLSFLSLLLLADMLRKNHMLLLQSATVGIEFLFVLSRESVYARGLRVLSTWERESGVRFANVAVVNMEDAEIAQPPAIGTVAYATVLHTVENYVCGAIVLGHSIRRSGSRHDMVALVSHEISNRSRDALREAGWIVKEIDRIRNPYGSKTSYNQWNYSKLRLWQLTEYSAVVFVDADLLVLRNLDHLFAFPDVAARGNDQTDFNSGLMLLRPSHCTFRELLANVHTIRSPNGGDQGYLNNIFTWWHRLPNSYNTLKHIWASDPHDRALELEMKNRWFSEEPAEIHTIHYLGRKPWQCYRDFDCTWLYPWDHNFANEAAHKRWWAMHDTMPESLQQMCWLRNEDKTEMEFRKRGLEAKNAPPGFWNFTVTDPRKDYCFPGQKTCQWELYLEHWKRR
ncbi:unnamed protein product [Closterium sp. NIES-64]|nr:unnamed protein product [Closterium sp. NIES-64]